MGLKPRPVSDVECLARAIVSEAGRGPEAEQRAIAWAVRNLAEARGQGIASLACSPPGRQGGRQAKGRRRLFATRQRATQSARRIAREVLLAPAGDDPINGATNFFEPAVQDRLFAAGRLRRSADQIRQRWREVFGLTLVATIGGWEFYARRKASRRTV